MTEFTSEGLQGLSEQLEATAVISDSFKQAVMRYAIQAHADGYRRGRDEGSEVEKADNGVSKIATNPVTIERAVRRAIDTEGSVTIRYRDAAGIQTTRTIEPFEWSPASGSKVASVVAYDNSREGDLRRFRLDRIEWLQRPYA